MTNEQQSKLKPCPRCWHGTATAHDSEGIHTIICNRCGFWVRSGGVHEAYYDWQAQSRWYEIRSGYADGSKSAIATEEDKDDKN